MSVAKQLYQLQEVDLELESNERALKQKTSQLGESPEVVKVRTELASQCQHLEEFKRQQHSAEWLQHEVDGLKAIRNQSEDKALEIMNQAELAEGHIATITNELKNLEADWQLQQQHLTTDIEQHETILSDLEQKRQLILAEIDPQTINLYQELKRQRGTAVARVDQGMCRGCQISLPTSELQRAKSGSLVRCSSCGRILFLA